ncbi:hypothetical protein NDU88_002054 [Pleurodeles waltl]|uniref:Uncharacterized protein n=1 Tax=Pleurodeles waltl TaxID=8319 RepID=A0AAV7VD83_PLEWA|nr:hypothetical protein NDU88_002054 [Pleurodeles waltl]
MSGRSLRRQRGHCRLSCACPLVQSMPPPPPSPAYRLFFLLVRFPPAGPSRLLEAAASQPRAGLAVGSGPRGEEDEGGALAAPIE